MGVFPPILRNYHGSKLQSATTMKGESISLMPIPHCYLHACCCRLSVSYSPKFRWAVIKKGIWPSLHFPHLGPNGKTIFAPLHAHVCSFRYLLHFLTKWQSSTLQHFSLSIFYRTGFSVLNSTKQFAVCFPPCGKHFCLSSRLREKCVISIHMSGAVEQVKQGPMLCNKSQPGENLYRTRSKLLPSVLCP